MRPHDENHRKQLLEDGYCLVPQVLSPDFVQELRNVTDRLIDEMTEEESRQQRSTGSMIPVVKDPVLARLIAHPPALRMVEAMGYRDVRFQSGYIISKPPQGPPLFWHFDWGFWNHPISYDNFPAQMFFMYYLTDTTRENGCLRVIPRSHREENPLHAQLAHAHTALLTEAKDLSRPEFQERPDEIDVTVKAGDLLIGDSRVLHAAHSNQSSARRTLITLWYHPEYNQLPDDLKAAFCLRRDPLPSDWPEEARRLYDSVAIDYEGTVPPAGFSRARKSETARKGANQ